MMEAAAPLDQFQQAGTGSPSHLLERLKSIAESHDCFKHPFFLALETEGLSKQQIKCLLKNYDAHASLLRRLLLKAATLMPEAAVTFVLENVRNEYGNGDYALNHQDQLRGLAWSCGVDPEEFRKCPVKPGVAKFLQSAARLYFPRKAPAGLVPAAVAAGAITATEILAVKEFACLQKSFAGLGWQHHIWFHHVSVEEEHTNESLALALYFIESKRAFVSVEYGLRGVLEANLSLYDGLLAAIRMPD